MPVNNRKKKLLCIVGATASGKTGLGVRLARELNGEIVSADSRQVFRRLDIGTGKDLGDYGDTKYHLIDICEPAEEFTMFDWLERAKVVLDDIWSRDKVPIVVGGTGLYVQALVQGFRTEQVKSQKSKVKSFGREELERKTKEELAEILIDLDEEAFLTIDLNNPYRMVRSIEKAQSGEKLTKSDPGFDFLLIGKEMPREELYSKIDKRVEEWFDEGFYEEVESLLENGVPLDWLNKVGLEYRILANFIQIQRLNSQELSGADNRDRDENSEIEKLIENYKLKIENFSSLDSVKQAMKYSIHQYARRQLIWWRRFQVDWVTDYAEAESKASKFLG